MTTDNKTLADVQPGGMVRPGDQAERARFDEFLSRNPLMALSAGTAWQVWQAALSAQPSPGGQGALDLDRVLSLADVHAEESREDGVRLLDRGGLLAFAQDVAAVLSAGQPVGETVAYLDLGAGGYMDVGTDLSDEELASLPKGRHMLGIIGTYGVDGYKSAQAVDLGAVREALRAAEGLATICASVDGYSREEVAASGRAMRQQFADALAEVDSQAVGNG